MKEVQVCFKQILFLWLQERYEHASKITRNCLCHTQAHLTSDVLFPKKISTINQGVHQKLEPPELRLVKTRKKSHEPFRRYRRLDFTTVFTK